MCARPTESQVLSTIGNSDDIDRRASALYNALLLWEDKRVSLQAEIAIFEGNRLSWTKDHNGQFVLIKGDEYSFHDSDEDAYRASVDKYGGQTDVLIKQILCKDVVETSATLRYGLLHADA